MSDSEFTGEQWALTYEIAADLRTYVEMVLRLERQRAFPDAFTDWLVVWSALLGAPAWETYTAVVILLRAGKVRAAYALRRSLYDYYVRLAYYHEQAKPIMAEWRADPRKMRHIKNGLRKIDAYRDWFSINKKMADHLRKMDLSDMEPEQLAKVQSAMAMSSAGETGVRVFRDMLDLTFPTDDVDRNLTYFQWQHRSAYLHGDPLTRIDVMREHIDESKSVAYDALFDETFLSANTILTGATHHVMGLMQKMWDMTDRHYAVGVLAPKVTRLFPIKTPRQKPSNAEDSDDAAPPRDTT